MPSYLPALQEPDYLALQPQSEYRSVITDVALDPPGLVHRLGLPAVDRVRRRVLPGHQR
ncbi:hypothetical protein ACFSTC_62175 [Nonomuraea ferruginea]